MLIYSRLVFHYWRSILIFYKISNSIKKPQTTCNLKGIMLYNALSSKRNHFLRSAHSIVRRSLNSCRNRDRAGQLLIEKCNHQQEWKPLKPTANVIGSSIGWRHKTSVWFCVRHTARENQRVVRARKFLGIGAKRATVQNVEKLLQITEVFNP